MNLVFTGLLFLASSSPAFAVAAGCANAAAYDQATAKVGVSTSYGKACEDLKKANDQTAAAVHNQKVQMPELNTNPGAGQADQLRALSQTSAGGAVADAQLAQIANAAQTSFLKTANDAQNAGQKLDQEAPGIQARANAAGRATLEAYRKQARGDFTQAQKDSEYMANLMGRQAVAHQQTVSRLMGQSGQTAAAADQLGSGVSSNTKALLIGGGVIAAGTVGGLYWVSKKSIDHAESAGHNLIADADTRVTRIITLTTNSATQVLKSAQDTAAAIVDKAKDGAVALSTELVTELKGSVGDLSVTGLGKLRDELDGVFQKLIADATAAGKTDLVAILTKSRQDSYNFITQEIAKRFGTSTGTTTGTGTGTATATATSTSTNTGTSSITSSTETVIKRSGVDTLTTY